MPRWNPVYTLLWTRLAIWQRTLSFLNSLMTVRICLSRNGVLRLLKTTFSAVLGLKRKLLVLPRDVIPTSEWTIRVLFILVVTCLLSLMLPTRSTIIARLFMVPWTSLTVLGSVLHPR